MENKGLPWDSFWMALLLMCIIPFNGLLIATSSLLQDRSLAVILRLQLRIWSMFKVENSLESPFCLTTCREQGGTAQVREDLAFIAQNYCFLGRE